MAGTPEQLSAVTLDSVREQFFLAHRATERFAAQLGSFLEMLQQQKPDDSWLEQVKDEATRTVQFYSLQHSQWANISSHIDSYIEDVRALAERMVVNELKGEQTMEAELPENMAKIVHPELVKFQLEKKAKILGKIGGIPALPGMGSVVPQLPRGQILKATASPAAREIYYSKVEDKDAAQLAGVFQFRKAAVSDVTPVTWQQEEATKNVRRASEAAADELRRAEQQEQGLTAGGTGGAELAGALRLRQRSLKSNEDDEMAATASSYKRPSASTSGAAGVLDRDLQAATPELAAKLKKRQEAAELARRHSEGDEKQQQSAAAAHRQGGSASADRGPAWGTTAPFGNELAAALTKRRQSKEAADAAKPVKPSSVPSTPSVASPASDELAQRLKKQQSKLDESQ
eukprot:GHRR01001087.1.p1 GENE.GHRR01001087.1~~GHRR01001087.1.p1  ORF type:complete len:402 (+),score=164.46 GHRR01001087.1:248-1453(+)